MDQSVVKLAGTLNRSVEKLLEQLRAAGVDKSSELDIVTDSEALRLRNYLRRLRGQPPVSTTPMRVSEVPQSAEIDARTATKNKLAALFNDFVRSPTEARRDALVTLVYEFCDSRPKRGGSGLYVSGGLPGLGKRRR